ncbi:alpha/beta hydrolase family protein [Sphingomonas changnyeongensis]|uniref:alpha/beta hydrolase family protein n=1 Tax=Sphingomonas changnyeongensis TaxID=2698679 RepID=UPI001E2F6257|nr:alpha/beta fold hydrolase [Sphingomonas changnyeongensis]
MVGVTYTTDVTAAQYFDAGLSRLRDSLSHALPGEPAIGFAGASDDEQRLLVTASSDVDPGTLFLLDRGAKKLQPLLRLYPGLADKKLANVRHVFVTAGDGTRVPAYLTLPVGSTGKGLPALVMPHGGPSARDEWGFDWLAQYFVHQGFAVLQPNYRGSAGYGDAWLRENGFKSWRTAIGDVVDSGRWLVAEGIADPDRLAIFGWSYGGYAALQSGVVAPGLFKAIVAVAPVTDFATLKAQYARSTAARLARFEIGSGPHVDQGSPYRNAGAITVPVQLFHGTLDQNVDVVQSRMMADALKDKGRPAELHLYPGLAHALADGAVRADMLTRSEAFIRAAFKAPPPR